MADFFTRLAERSMGLVTQVRPDYPSALAPAVDAAALGEDFFIDSVPARPAPRAPTELRPPAEVGEAAAAMVTPLKVQPPVQPPVQAPPPSEAQTTRPTAPVEAQVQGGESHFSVEPTVASAPIVAQRPVPDTRRVAPGSRQEVAGAAAPVDSRSVTAVPERRQPAATGAEVQLPSSSPSPQWRPAVAPPVPTVQVTIGRVEVRAVTPPPTTVQSRPVERRASARLTLDDYLRQRNEGRR